MITEAAIPLFSLLPSRFNFVCLLCSWRVATVRQIGVKNVKTALMQKWYVTEYRNFIFFTPLPAIISWTVTECVVFRLSLCLCVIFLFFLFFRGDCERRGWYDSSQSALRPHSDMAQCTVIPIMYANFNVLVCEYVVRNSARGRCVSCSRGLVAIYL